jgi:hypothetical protein
MWTATSSLERQTEMGEAPGIASTGLYLRARCHRDDRSDHLAGDAEAVQQSSELVAGRPGPIAGAQCGAVLERRDKQRMLAS